MAPVVELEQTAGAGLVVGEPEGRESLTKVSYGDAGPLLPVVGEPTITFGVLSSRIMWSGAKPQHVQHWTFALGSASRYAK